MKSPVEILREDTISNEFTELRGTYDFPMKDEIKTFDINGGKIELNGNTRKAYSQKTGDVLFSFNDMSKDEFLKILNSYRS